MFYFWGSVHNNRSRLLLFYLSICHKNYHFCLFIRYLLKWLIYLIHSIREMFFFLSSLFITARLNVYVCVCRNSVVWQDASTVAPLASNMQSAKHGTVKMILARKLLLLQSNVCSLCLLVNRLTVSIATAKLSSLNIFQIILIQ